MAARGFRMTLPPEVSVALITFGGVVIGVLGTMIGAVVSSRNASKKNSVDRELGMTNAQREWVSMQMESMRIDINNNRAHYESVIASMQVEHKAELKRQEDHCQGRLDTLSNQIIFLTDQLNAYAKDLRRSGVCVTPPSFENG